MLVTLDITFSLDIPTPAELRNATTTIFIFKNTLQSFWNTYMFPQTGTECHICINIFFRIRYSFCESCLERRYFHEIAISDERHVPYSPEKGKSKFKFYTSQPRGFTRDLWWRFSDFDTNARNMVVINYVWISLFCLFHLQKATKKIVLNTPIVIDPLKIILSIISK